MLPLTLNFHNSEKQVTIKAGTVVTTKDGIELTYANDCTSYVPEISLVVVTSYTKMNKDGRKCYIERAEKFEQTVDSNNRNVLGNPKSEYEIKIELQDEFDTWMHKISEKYPDATFYVY